MEAHNIIAEVKGKFAANNKQSFWKAVIPHLTNASCKYLILSNNPFHAK